MLLLILLLTAIYGALLVFFLVMCYPRLKCWSYAFKKQERLVNETNNKLAILVPARNESLAIGTLFDCLLSQTYPRECFDVHVIVKEENDPTIAMAHEKGFFTHVASEQTCKSDALDFCLQKILATDPDAYEAYIILDADCALDTSFLEEMNNALASGADIICSKKKVKNYFWGTKREQPMSACCNAIIWTLLDNMGNSYKSAHGYPCFTVGTGLMLRSNVIKEKNGWQYKATMTEDVELMHEAVLDGRKFFYYEHAVIYMEEAQRLSQTNKRRTRWLSGVVDSDRLYGKRVSRSCRFEDRYYTSALNYVYCYVGTSVIFACIMALLSIILAIAGSPLLAHTALLTLLAIAVIYTSFFITTVVAMLSDRKNIKLPVYKKIALAFVHPLFYMQYIFIIGKALLTHGNRKWEVIERVQFSGEKETHHG